MRQDSWNNNVRTAADYTPPAGTHRAAPSALGSGADAPPVLTVQTLRLFAVVLAGALLGWWSS